MINILMNQKRGLNRFSKLPDDGDPRAPYSLLKPGAKEEKNTSWVPVKEVNIGFIKKMSRTPSSLLVLILY